MLGFPSGSLQSIIKTFSGTRHPPKGVSSEYHDFHCCKRARAVEPALAISLSIYCLNKQSKTHLPMRHSPSSNSYITSPSPTPPPSSCCLPMYCRVRRGSSRIPPSLARKPIAPWIKRARHRPLGGHLGGVEGTIFRYPLSWLSAR